MDFDLVGTGNTVVTAVRAERALTNQLALEVGSLFAKPTEHTFTTTTLVAPEALVRYTLFDRRLSPYVGGGGGFVMRHHEGRSKWDPSMTGAAGLQFTLTDETAVQGELRLRGIGRRFGASSAEWTAGLVWRPSVS